MTTSQITITGPDTNTVDVLSTYPPNVNMDTVRFAETPSPLPANLERVLYWNDAEGTLDLGLAYGLLHSIGQQILYPPTKNNSGEAIPNGSFVMATGAQGDRITIAKAVTDGSVAHDYMIGVASRDIPDGSEDGHIVTFGYVKNIDTDAYPVGTILYPDPMTPGGWTDTQPTAPAWRVPVAIVVRQQQNTGRIIVRMNPSSELGGTDTNVVITNPQVGDVLTFDGTNWINQAP